MKALFNGHCCVCGQFKPRCASVYFRIAGKASVFDPEPRTMCADCRKSPAQRGRFRADDRHK